MGTSEYRDVERLGALSPFGWKRAVNPLLRHRLELIAQQVSSDGSLGETYQHGPLFIREQRDGTATWSLTAAFRVSEAPETWLPMGPSPWQPVPNVADCPP